MATRYGRSLKEGRSGAFLLALGRSFRSGGRIDGVVGRPKLPLASPGSVVALHPFALKACDDDEELFKRSKRAAIPNDQTPSRSVPEAFDVPPRVKSLQSAHLCSEKFAVSVYRVYSVSVKVNLAAYLEGGPACASVGALTLRAGLAHVPSGANTNYLQHSTHDIGRIEPAAGMLIACAGCDKPILDKFLLNVLERPWHASCVRCFDCHAPLTDKCFSRESKLFCRSDFFRRYGTKCGGCGQGISPSDLVRKGRDKVFHINCFTCLVCRKQPSTGEELYVIDDSKFLCKDDYLNGNKTAVIPSGPPHHQDSLMGSASEDEDDDDNSTASSIMKHHTSIHGSLPPAPGETNNNSLPHSDISGSIGQDSKTGQDDSEDQNSLDGDPETRDSQTENKSPDDSGAGSKRRGPRTTIKAKQLEILKTAFSQTPKPTRHIREQLAKETGLPMRVIQVWFQNKRSKERRLKQLTSMGRGPFFGGSRKMRGFPMNLSPGGLEDGPPGFPYFDGKFEFGYGGPPFHPHDAPFFPGHHPGNGGPGQGMPFGQGGGPMDHGPMPMGGDFGGIPGEQGQFMQQGPQDQMMQGNGGRGGSPEFMTSGGFADNQQQLNEGLVW